MAIGYSFEFFLKIASISRKPNYQPLSFQERGFYYLLMEQLRLKTIQNIKHYFPSNNFLGGDFAIELTYSSLIN